MGHLDVQRAPRPATKLGEGGDPLDHQPPDPPVKPAGGLERRQLLI